LRPETRKAAMVGLLGAARIGKIHAASVAANPQAKFAAACKALGAQPMTAAMAAITGPDVDTAMIGTPIDGSMLRSVELGNLRQSMMRDGVMALQLAERAVGSARTGRTVAV
jgi:myo-inositol 2-dehydrogenase / D-chiro-inositol 1-dehydrogenase